MKLTADDRAFMALVIRSKDTGDGWKNVSSILMKLVKPNVEKFPELYELETNEDGTGRIRLTEKGQTISEYL